MGLLGYVLSLKAGVPYGELVKDRILNVLGMDSTGIAMNNTQITTPLPDILKSRLAKGHMGGREVSLAFLPEVIQPSGVTEFENKLLNNTPITPQEIKLTMSASLGPAWIRMHPNSLDAIPKKVLPAKDLSPGVPVNTQVQQQKVVLNWRATNWIGICDELSKISNPTLMITGTDDGGIQPANSLIIAGKIPGSWLVQIKDAGHQVMSQYPDKFNKVLQTFLSTTN